MAHEVETMAWSTEVPWHGLGVQVDPKADIETWVHMAGIDWTVDMRPMMAACNDGESPLYDVPIPGHYALVRSTDNRVLTVVGDRWNPVQNKEVVDFFNHFVSEGGATMETLGSLKGGRVVWGLAALNDKFLVGGSHDVVKGYLLMASHHILGKANIAKVTGVRVVCANTLAAAFGEASKIEQRFDHTQTFSASAAAEAMGLAREDFVKFGKIANQLAKLKITQTDVVRILQPILDPQNGPEMYSVKAMKEWAATYEPNRVMEGVLASYQDAPGATPGTGWGLLNGLTHYADHVAKGDADSRLASAWLGNYARKKQTLLDTLVEMAT